MIKVRVQLGGVTPESWTDAHLAPLNTFIADGGRLLVAYNDAINGLTLEHVIPSVPVKELMYFLKKVTRAGCCSRRAIFGMLTVCTQTIGHKHKCTESWQKQVNCEQENCEHTWIQGQLLRLYTLSSRTTEQLWSDLFLCGICFKNENRFRGERVTSLRKSSRRLCSTAQ